MADPGVLVKTLLAKNFAKFGTIRKLCTYQSMAVSGYNVETGDVTDSVTTTDTFYAIWDEFSFTQYMAATNRLDDTTVLLIDRKVIFVASDISVEPKIGDRIVDDNLGVWSVKSISLDPAGAHYELHVRPIQ